MSLRDLPLLALLLPLLACGPSSEEVAEMKAAQEAMVPFKVRFDEIHTSLPAAGKETEVACTETIGKDGLMTMNLIHLEYSLGKTPADAHESWDRTRFDHGIGHNLREGLSPRPDAEPSRGALMNLESSARALGEVKHVVVFRPTSVDKGEVAGKTADGSFEIKRPAVWKGWVFAFEFDDDPALVGAFPVEATSREKMTVTTRGGAPSSEVLIDDAALFLRERVIERLGKKGCPAG